MVGVRSIFIAVIQIAAVSTTEAQLGPLNLNGRPVTPSDISGKTFCWSNGHKGTYGANGIYTNDRGTRTTWSIPEFGVITTGAQHLQTEVLPDGQLHMYSYVLRSQHHDRDTWGTPCK
jgi:hypothetical protein